MIPKRQALFENPPNEEAESLILKAVRSIRYGSVEVTIHNARVVQIEQREKLRFTLPARIEAKGLTRRLEAE